MLRLTGSLRLAARSKTLRMPETSIERILSAIQWSCMGTPIQRGAARTLNRKRGSCAVGEYFTHRPRNACAKRQAWGNGERPSRPRAGCRAGWIEPGFELGGEE